MSGPSDLDLAHINWSSPEWIYHLPTKTLSTPDEAMDYFALSPFWDIRSNNQTLRVQRRVVDPLYGSAQERFELPSFTQGFEYVVAHTLPPDLFVIQRRTVNADGSRNNVTGAWFILEGKVYPSPSVYDVMASRLKNASFLVGSTFSELSKAHPPSNPRAHSTWRSLPPTAETDTKEQEKEKEETTAPSSGPSGIDNSDKEKDTEGTKTGPNFALLNALASSRQAISHLDTLSKQLPPTLDPEEELQQIETEVLGANSISGRDGAGAGATAAPGSGRGVSVSVAPVRERSAIGTPGSMARTGVVGRTPGVGTSPLASFGA